MDQGGGREEYFAYLGDAFSDYPGSDSGMLPFAFSNEEPLSHDVQSTARLALVRESPERLGTAVVLRTGLLPIQMASCMPLSNRDALLNCVALNKGKKAGFLDRAQSQIWIETSDGRMYTPRTVREFVAVLKEIHKRGVAIRRLVIKGHGWADPAMIDLGDDGILTISADGRQILVSEKEGLYLEDITALLMNVVDASSIIEFRGCHTADLAENTDRILGGTPRTWGSRYKVLGIPWTYIGIGLWDAY